MAKAQDRAKQTAMTHRGQQSAAERAVAVAGKHKQNITGDELALSRQLAGRLTSIKSVAAKHLTPERLCRISVQSVMRNPYLLKAAVQSPETFIAAVVECSVLGLEPVGPLGHAYLIPRWNNKTRRNEVSMLVGYRGYIELAARSDRLKSLSSEVVYEGDHFKVMMGTEEKLEHIPDFHRTKDAKLLCAYAIAHMKDGGYNFHVMTRVDIEKARESSESYKAHKAGKLSADNCPWVKYESEMWRKTAVRNLAKYLPMSPELQRAAVADDLRDQGIFTVDNSIVDIPVEATAEVTPEPAKSDPEPAQEPVKAKSNASTPDPEVKDAGPLFNGQDPTEPAPDSKKMEEVERWKPLSILQGDLEKKLGDGEPPIPFAQWSYGDLATLQIHYDDAGRAKDKNKRLTEIFGLEAGSLE